ncbi:MAG TPA: ATP-binding cassette domain-containing protein, partial [Candidatus Latescibacteria bacterium]|nr:ATP-binding cassette domain-containing protein [Candidatus Latescibacterota bacterium]
MLELSDVSKSFAGTTALHSTDLAIRPGATTVLIGPSGCGKSTLLRLMICLIQPDTGSVLFEGSPLASSDVIELRHRMGYVIQDGGLFPHLTARGNVCLLARHLRWESRRLDNRLDELAELTHFPVDGLDRFPAQLSGGQKQRVSLINSRPQLLSFLDDEIIDALAYHLRGPGDRPVCGQRRRYRRQHAATQ